MDNTHYKGDLYPDALHLFKKKRITNMNKIREFLSQEYPDNLVAIDDALERLKSYRKSMGLRYLIIGATLIFIGIAARPFIEEGGIIGSALRGASGGGGLVLLIQGYINRNC